MFDKEKMERLQTIYMVIAAFIVAVLMAIHPNWAIWPEWAAKVLSATLIVGLSGAIFSDWTTNLLFNIQRKTNHIKHGSGDSSIKEAERNFFLAFYWDKKWQKYVWIFVAVLFSWILMSS